MNKYDNLLTPTMIVPLWARALDSQSSEPILGDRKAYELLQKLGYNLDYLDKNKQRMSYVGCCLRAKWIDDEAKQFIAANAPCQVIQLGAGLDDRFRRMGFPEAVEKWYDLDLPEVANIRRELIGESERSTILSQDLFDYSWMDPIVEKQLPTLVIIEGVLMYFSQEQIRELFEQIAQRLGQATILFDSVSDKIVNRARYHDSVQKNNNENIEFTWSATDEKYLAQLSPVIKDIKLLHITDLPEARHMPMLYKILVKIPYVYKHYNQLLIRLILKR